MNNDDRPGLSWQPVTREDLTPLAELADECYRVDGGLDFLNRPDNLLERYFPAVPGAAIGAFDKDGHLVACATVHLFREPDDERVRMVGQVRPDLRRRGIGTYLMQWSEQQAQALLAESPASKKVRQIATETLTDPADRLYRAFGFEPVMVEVVMRCDLHPPLPDRPFPADISITTWQPGLDDQFFQAYDASFRDRPGFPGWSAAEWITWTSDDEHFKPEWSLLAQVEGQPAGFITASSEQLGGYINQVGVVPALRRCGIASALLVESLRRMQTAGAEWVLLTVATNNPGAIETYQQIGFVTAGRRARYERIQ